MRKNKPAPNPEAPSVASEAPAAPTVQRTVVVTNDAAQTLSRDDALRQLGEGLLAPEQSGDNPPAEVDDEAQVPVEDEGQETPETNELAESDAAPEPDAEVDEEDLEELSELSEEELTAHGQEKGWPASYTKRVKKFTRKLREAQAKAEGAAQMREEREALKAKVAELEGTKPQETAQEVEVNDGQVQQFGKQLGEIDKQVDGIDKLLIWAKRNPEGGTLRDKDGKEVEVDADYVIEMSDKLELRKRQLDREASRLIAKREARLSQVAVEEQEQVKTVAKKALELYPWLNDPKSAEWKKADQFVKENPDIRLLRNWPLIVGQVIAANGTPKPNGNGNGHPPSRPPARPAAAPMPQSNSRKSNDSAALSQAMKSGNRQDAEAAILSLVEGRR
jgi:hypothetical protein